MRQFEPCSPSLTRCLGDGIAPLDRRAVRSETLLPLRLYYFSTFSGLAKPAVTLADAQLLRGDANVKYSSQVL